MNPPTKEQIEAARRELEGLAINPFGLPASKRNAIRTLLAATAEPTEAGLAEEAERYAPSSAACTCAMRMAYLAGVRREGRK